MTANYNVIVLLKDAAKESPNRAALVIREKSINKAISFGQLWEKVDSFSAAIRAKGLEPGERVILMIPMSIELYIALLGIIKIGAVAVFADPWVSRKQIAAFCTFASPSGFIGVGKSHLLRLFSRKLLQIPLTVTTGPTLAGIPARYSLKKLLSSSKGDGRIYHAQPDDPALITFTSGSSGLPKGANRTHGFLLAQYEALTDEFPYRQEDIDMPMFPVFALRNLAGRITSIIPDMDFRKVREVEPSVILRQIREHNVTTCTASPPFITRLTEHLVENKLAPPLLRRVLTGGAPVDTEQLKRWRNALPDTEVQVVYGSTEAEPVAHLSLEDRLKAEEGHEEKGYCTGKVSSHVRAKIITITKGPFTATDNWGSVELPPGESGELVVSGDHVCTGYYNNPQATGESKIIGPDGTIWHRMGDTGYFDHHNMFWLVGRLHSTIVRNGKVWHAQLVEQKVRRCLPDLEMVAAIGLVRDSSDEELMVVIKTSNNTPLPQTLAQDLKQQGVEVDRVIQSRDPLPLDPRHNSKIDYSALRKKIITNQI
ncbi:MAG: AMP-binding protein [Proteobacteria bacterium]|nr:AMP-binding protein [Pseudomonadota bacterium]MBU1736706.1 AMP-binding protein [Pseudomonadota bacterium]